ncbi:rhodanese-like domain-containing protein [Nonlabens agnitus]|uniref:Rhodanese n=1 Tax=Nonlabens agnitus TaxID=870484 RepID=A0A2S9WQ82_9FLAO|nr:rhodanese-like domain-containing protein [Nonlabens agnitus]PRP65643.1 rhodanese [Nonlabens agnitus]
MKNILIALLVLGFSSNIQAQSDSLVTVLSKKEFKEAITKNEVQLVDVRTSAEFGQGAIDGAINIDYFEKDQFKESFEQLNKSKPIYIYCRSGNRSGKAAIILEELGFTKIYDLKGGYLDWTKEE